MQSQSERPEIPTSWLLPIEIDNYWLRSIRCSELSLVESTVLPGAQLRQWPLRRSRRTKDKGWLDFEGLMDSSGLVPASKRNDFTALTAPIAPSLRLVVKPRFFETTTKKLLLCLLHSKLCHCQLHVSLMGFHDFTGFLAYFWTPDKLHCESEAPNSPIKASGASP